MDFEVGYFGQYVVYGVAQILFIFGMVCYNSPLMIIIFFVLFIVFVVSFKKYILLATEIKKIQSIKIAPVFSKISEAFNGSAVIKAFQIEK